MYRFLCSVIGVIFFWNYSKAQQLCDISSDSVSLYLYQAKGIKYPDRIYTSDKIKEVFLHRLPIAQMEAAIEQIAQMKRVERIIIHGCNLKFLPYNIYKVKSLKYLDLRSNNLETLPYSIKYCDNLEYIDLDRNKMSHYGISYIFKNVKNLTMLSISENNLHEIPESVCEAKKLAFFNIEDNNISKLPDCLYHMDNLKVLGITSYWKDRYPLPNPNSINIEEVRNRFQKNGLRVRIEHR